MLAVFCFFLLMFLSDVKSAPYHNICPHCTDHGLVSFWNKSAFSIRIFVVNFFEQGYNEYLLREEWRDYSFQYFANPQCMDSHYETILCKATCFRVKLYQIERNRSLILGWAFGCTKKSIFAVPPIIAEAPPDLKNIKQDYTFEDRLYGLDGKRWMLDFDIYKHDYDVQEAQIYYRDLAHVHQRQKEQKEEWDKCQQNLWKCHYKDFKRSKYVPYAIGIGAVGVIVIIFFCRLCIKINMYICGCSKKKKTSFPEAIIAYRKSENTEEDQVIIANGEYTALA